MSEAILSEPLVTIGEFDAYLESQQDGSLWELVAGRDCRHDKSERGSRENREQHWRAAWLWR